MGSDALVEKIETLQNMLVSLATGGGLNDALYSKLRKELTEDAELKEILPRFLRTCRDSHQFWQLIKAKYPSYKERRTYLWDEFRPALEFAEGQSRTPADKPVSDALSSFDREGVHKVWTKALSRRDADGEGAITSARTLLETVCKHILDSEHVVYSDDADLPKLYRLTAETLLLAPSQHTEQIFKQILGSCQAVVEGLGALRNKLSDSHGKGKRPVKPAERHVELAVNLAGSMAAFLVETYQERKKNKNN